MIYDFFKLFYNILFHMNKFVKYLTKGITNGIRFELLIFLGYRLLIS